MIGGLVIVSRGSVSKVRRTTAGERKLAKSRKVPRVREGRGFRNN